MRWILPLFFGGLTAAAFVTGGFCWGVLFGVFFLVAAFGLSFNHVTQIDTDGRVVRRITTFCGLLFSERQWPFDSFMAVRLSRNEDVFQLDLTRPRRWALGLTHGDERLRQQGRDLAEMMGLRWIDED